MKSILFCFLFISFSVNGQQNLFDTLFAIEKNFSGVVLIAENGKANFHKAFGYREFESQIPLQTSDIFELASVSKQFTAMIIMMLKEKGFLNYDDSVSKYLDIPYKGITIRHLLTHTSGLPDYQEIMDKYWDKSKVAGNPDCIEQCRKWIFRKLKMKSTNIRTLEEKKATENFAIGHIYVQEREKYIRADSFPSSDYTIWLGNRKGPGRISSSASDLLKWDKALYTNKLINQSTLQEAFAPMKLNDGSFSNYGFGWSLRTDSVFGKVVSHNGDNPGYKTQIIRFIEKRKTIILLNNNAHPNFTAILRRSEAIIKE